MIFRKFIKFVKGGDVEQYLTRDIGALIDDMSAGIHKLDLEDNFQVQMIVDSDRKLDTVLIYRDSEVAISHKLKQIPRYHLVLNGVAGVVEGATDWTNETVYLQLDSDVYAAGVSKEVKLLLFK